MRLPRVRVWVCMAVVVIMAVGLKCMEMKMKSKNYLMLAVRHETNERHFRMLLGLRERQRVRIIAALAGSEGSTTDQTRDASRDSVAELRSLLGRTENEISEFREDAAAHRVNANAYRKAARRPWRGAPSVRRTNNLHHLRSE
jgi:hypothetical protein